MPDLGLISLGPLPVARINKTLGLELEEGLVVLTANAQRHIAKKPDHEYAACLPFLGATIDEPTYVGDDFKNPGIELIRRMPDKRGLLVALRLERNAEGQYEVVTMYPVTQAKIDSRRAAGHLRTLSP